MILDTGYAPKTLAPHHNDPFRETQRMGTVVTHLCWGPSVGTAWPSRKKRSVSMKVSIGHSGWLRKFSGWRQLLISVYNFHGFATSSRLALSRFSSGSGTASTSTMNRWI